LDLARNTSTMPAAFAIAFPAGALWVADPISAGAARRPESEDGLTALIERVQQGELAAFEQIYRRKREHVYRILYQLVGNSPDLDDLIQESFIQLLKALKGFRGDAKFSTFLYRVCANVAFMHLRSKGRRREDLVEEAPEPAAARPVETPERRAEVNQAARILESALAQLPPERRIVFVYHDFLGMGPEEIAEALGIPPNTARSRLMRARQDLVEVVNRFKGEPRRAGGDHGAP
jgi:RNA polymerase sigma-70 factor (ECF subfamily)